LYSALKYASSVDALLNDLERAMAGLHQSSFRLPKDLWLVVFIHLSPEDLISLREVRASYVHYPHFHC
jgi:hypothetical protein